MVELLNQVLPVVVGATIPTLILLVGGQRLLNRYEVSKKQREQELELARFIRERQYEAVQELYALFARFMSLYRKINAEDTDLHDCAVRHRLFVEAVEAESTVDAAILRIGSEFTSGNRAQLEPLLGNLRQAVQLWRESVRDSKKLPFTWDEQPDYLRFKAAFAGTCAYMANRIYQSLAPAHTQMEEARELLRGASSNLYETSRARDEFLKSVGASDEASQFEET